MRPVAKRLSILAGLLAVAVSAGTGSALAHDDDYGWKHKRHHVPPGHVYYVERPIVVERPVVFARPRVVYPEPMYYGPPAPSLNINIPLR